MNTPETYSIVKDCNYILNYFNKPKINKYSLTYYTHQDVTYFYILYMYTRTYRFLVDKKLTKDYSNIKELATTLIKEYYFHVNSREQ